MSNKSSNVFEMEKQLVKSKFIMSNFIKNMHTSLEGFKVTAGGLFQVDSQFDIEPLEENGIKITRMLNTSEGVIKNIEKFVGSLGIDIERIEAISAINLSSIGEINYSDGTKFRGMMDSSQTPAYFGLWTTPDGQTKLKLDETVMYGLQTWVETSKNLDEIILWLNDLVKAGYLKEDVVHYLFTMASILDPEESAVDNIAVEGAIMQANNDYLKGAIIKTVEDNELLNNFKIVCSTFSQNPEELRFELYWAQDNTPTRFQNFTLKQLSDFATTVAEYFSENGKILYDFETFAFEVCAPNLVFDCSKGGLKALFEDLKLPESTILYLSDLENFGNIEFYIKRNGLEKLENLSWSYRFQSTARESVFERFNTCEEYLGLLEKVSRWKGVDMYISLKDSNTGNIYPLFYGDWTSLPALEKRIFNLK